MTASESSNRQARAWLREWRELDAAGADHDARSAVYAVAVAHHLGATPQELVQIRLAAETRSAPDTRKFLAPPVWDALIALAAEFDLRRNLGGEPVETVLATFASRTDRLTIEAFRAVDRQVVITLD